jgi:hypothetical protein
MLCLVEVVALFIDHGIEHRVLLRLLIDDQATVASRGAYAHDTSVPPRKGSRRVAAAAGRRRPLPNKPLKLAAGPESRARRRASRHVIRSRAAAA